MLCPGLSGCLIGGKLAVRAPVDLTDPPANQDPGYFHRILRQRKVCDTTNREERGLIPRLSFQVLLNPSFLWRRDSLGPSVLSSKGAKHCF